MNKRIKKKLQKRGGYRSWKRWKSFDFHFSIIGHDEKKNKLGTLGVIGISRRMIFPTELNKNIRVYSPDTIAEAIERFRDQSIEDVSKLQFDIDLSCLNPGSNTFASAPAFATRALRNIQRKPSIWIPYKGEIEHPKEGDKCGSNE